MALSQIPETVRGTLEAFVETTKNAFSDDLRAIVLYGSWPGSADSTTRARNGSQLRSTPSR